jgi:iron complex outermembrane receptor protein
VYEPEKLTAYTVGAKNRFLDDRLQLNLEAFYWDYRDQQISHLLLDSQSSVIFGTENVGKATMKGGEIELQWLVLDHTLLGVDVQYLDAIYDEFSYSLPRLSPVPPASSCSVAPAVQQTQNLWSVNCDGKVPPQSPEWSVNLGVQQTFPFGNGAELVADLRTHYQSETLTGLEFLPSEIQESYWMSNASLTFRAPENRWSLSAYVSNIEDEAVFDSTSPHPLAPELIAATLRPPRTYGARIVINF